MNNSKIFSIGLVALTTLAITTPTAQSHNPAKYASVPFVVPAFESSVAGSSSRWVNQSGKLVLSVTAPTGPPVTNTGFTIFPSVPGSSAPGNPNPPVVTGTFPQGTLTFTQSGIPSGVRIHIGSGLNAGDVLVSGSTVSFFCGDGNPAHTLAVINVFIDNTAPQPNVTAILSNFTLNGKAVLLDTSQFISDF